MLFQEQKLKETRLLRSQCAACLALGRRFWLAQGHLGSQNEGLMKLMKTPILKTTILDTACIQKAKISSPVRYRLAMGGAVGHEEERSEGPATQHGILAVGLCRLFSSGWFSDAPLPWEGYALASPCALVPKLAVKLKLGVLPHRLSSLCPRGESSVESSRSFSNTNKPSPLGATVLLEDEDGFHGGCPRARSQPPLGMQANPGPNRWRDVL